MENYYLKALQELAESQGLPNAFMPLAQFSISWTGLVHGVLSLKALVALPRSALWRVLSPLPALREAAQRGVPGRKRFPYVSVSEGPPPEEWETHYDGKADSAVYLTLVHEDVSGYSMFLQQYQIVATTKGASLEQTLAKMLTEAEWLRHGWHRRVQESWAPALQTRALEILGTAKSNLAFLLLRDPTSLQDFVELLERRFSREVMQGEAAHRVTTACVAQHAETLERALQRVGGRLLLDVYATQSMVAYCLAARLEGTVPQFVVRTDVGLIAVPIRAVLPAGLSNEDVQWEEHLEEGDAVITTYPQRLYCLIEDSTEFRQLLVMNPFTRSELRRLPAPREFRAACEEA